MKVQNMINSNGNTVANQFIINASGKINWMSGLVTGSGTIFQSYESTIVFKEYNGKVYLDKTFWNYSVTTGRYRNQFLEEGINETRKKIESGEYTLVDLN